MTRAAGAALRVEALAAGYQPEIEVLAGVTLDAAPGRITAVIGANGAGKSTLLRVVFGLLPARTGRLGLASTARHTCCCSMQPPCSAGPHLFNRVSYGDH